MAGIASPAVRGSKNILCVSWLPNLAETRRLLLASEGYGVESVIGTAAALERSRNNSIDLLIMGQSVPRDEKRRIVEAFRRYNSAPILSLLNPGQEKLPEVEYGVDSLNPEQFLRTVRSILNPSR